MRYLKLFENHQTESEEKEICYKYGIAYWTLNSDGLVDIRGNVNLSSCNLTKLPLKFGEVTGYFQCEHNYLTTLEGAPHTVGNFDCQGNKLTSLEGAPRLVRGYFDFEDNKICSFEGLVHIGNYVYSWGNPVGKIWDIICEKENPYKWDNEKMDFFNDLDIIRLGYYGKKEIAIERLNFFLEEIGKKPVESVEGYKNIY